jgi:hypothetical protein
LLYYPAKRILLGDFSIPWVCVHGFPAPICVEILRSCGLADDVDLGRAFGSMSSDSCDAVSEGSNDDGNLLDAEDAGGPSDSIQEGSGAFTLASARMVAAPALFGFLIMGLLW